MTNPKRPQLQRRPLNTNQVHNTFVELIVVVLSSTIVALAICSFILNLVTGA